MTIHIRAHFDGRVLVPDQPVDLPIGKPLDVDVTESGTNGLNGGAPPTAEVIQERQRRLDSLNGLLAGPVIPLEELRRENLYDDRA